MNRPAAWLCMGMCVGLYVTLGLAVSGCGEKLQSADPRKSDLAPSQGASKSAVAAYTAQGWKAGDATSWDAQIKRRSEGQNEYTRTSRQ